MAGAPPVILSAAKDLYVHREETLRCAQGDNRGHQTDRSLRSG